MKVAGLFAGIGGFELGFERAGLKSGLLCDVLPASKAVLEARFPGVPFHQDIRKLRSLPSDVEVICGGFPCQDLSQAGRTAGLEGEQSGLIGEVFRLLGRRRVPTVVIENVPFMLQLNGGKAIRAIIDEFERRGYRWAYRVVDSFSFGLPQRRERVLLVASRELDPAAVLLADDKPLTRPTTAMGTLAHGFYWTEGLTGLGWAVDAVPTLKNGSTIGIPSPPAIAMPDGRLVKPTLEDAERLQGFEAGWTSPADSVGRASKRWSLVGSAVSVPVAEWVGKRLLRPGTYNVLRDAEFPLVGKAPKAARFDGKRRFSVTISQDPIGVRAKPLSQFLSTGGEELSLRAALGFLTRTRRAKLRFDPAFIKAVERHVTGLGGALPPYPPGSQMRKVA
ncbi:DNA cytosine methyltransferase [Variovorax sp. J22R24]|uniref:DNA cytosine methyltransferase n=1 Tax=Variovorax gracilis TaxID=3053502 RepID=UPI00257730D6|nr:DNA cytosine methyltransferase [Variovorax sp. J22R24]MDM0109838.1 DNA cytosine methyltransferase [Variovorax sp. J22R24]